MAVSSKPKNYVRRGLNMERFSCLAIDMGAGSIRIVQGIFGNSLELKEVYRFENAIETIDGHERWNLKRITSEIGKGIEKALAETEVPICSIGADSWGVDFVLIDNEGNPLEDPVAYRDPRTKGMKETWEKLMSEKETFERTGINYNLFNSLFQFLSIKGNAKVKNADSVLFMADYVNYFLSGRKENELSLASTGQMINVGSRKWDADILRILEMGHLFKKKPVSAGHCMGLMKGFGKEKIEVIAVAGHDTACAVAAIPLINSNCAFIATGTWCIVGMLSPTPFLSDEAYKIGITNEMAYDGRFRPLKNLMGLWLIQQLRVAFGEKHSYNEIDNLAENEPVSEWLIDPYDESFYNPVNMKTAFDNYLKTVYGATFYTEAQYYRCAFDSLAASFNKTLQQFEKLRGKPFDAVHLIGGGVKSGLLCSLTAIQPKKQ
jgi:rhamnulokinase